jgi:hypothetical protein
MISFIVSVYDRIDMLHACLASLEVQDGEKEVLICHNGPGDPWIRIPQAGSVVKTGTMGCGQCYESANMVAPMATGEWLCFPSDDSLYVQGFSRIMIETAVREQADLVYCDMVYKCGSEVNSWKPYSVLESEPRMGRIDKSNFILRHELFKGFPPHPRFWCDGALIEQLMTQGVRHAKAPGILAVHQ